MYRLVGCVCSGFVGRSGDLGGRRERSIRKDLNNGRMVSIRESISTTAFAESFEDFFIRNYMINAVNISSLHHLFHHNLHFSICHLPFICMVRWLYKLNEWEVFTVCSRVQALKEHFSLICFSKFLMLYNCLKVKTVLLEQNLRLLVDRNKTNHGLISSLSFDM